MIVLGLTGSIGMGKSTTARLFRLLGQPVYDADREVHALSAPGGRAVAPILAAFPEVRNASGGIDRAALGRLVFADRPALGRLEGILHPMVGAAQRRILAAFARRRARLVVLDIPLLLEGGGERRCDAVVVVTAPAFLQRDRVLARPGMTAERFRGILRRQMPDREKRRRADHVVQTGIGRRHALRQLRRILDREIARIDRPARGRLSRKRRSFRLGGPP
jgi:dephospho-CoA kinase